MNIAELVGQWARHEPNRPALIDGTRTLSYAELDSLARGTAAHLGGRGLGPGNRLGLCLRDDTDFIATFLGVARLGAVSVVMDWRAPAMERARLAETLQLATTVIAEPVRRHSEMRVLNVDAAWRLAVEGAGHDRRPCEAGGDAVVEISSTSGTTGAPKGLRLTHAALLARWNIARRTAGWGRDARYLSTLPLTFSASRYRCLYFLLCGNTVVLHPTVSTAAETVTALRSHAATATLLVPALIRRMLALGPGAVRLPDMRHLLIGGDILRAEEKLAAASCMTPHLYEIYASAVAGPMTMLRPEDLPAKAATVGRACVDVELEVVDENGAPVSPGITGRVRVRSKGLANPLGVEARAIDGETVRGGWAYTGDFGVLDEASYLRLEGRGSDRIMRGGVTILPAEIEAVLAGHSSVADVAVVARPSSDLGEEIVAFVVGHGALDTAALAGYCRERLAPHKCPREFVVVESLPRNRSGKVARQHLRERLPP